MTYQAIIVEDERLAREALREMVQQVAWLNCCAEAETGRDAVTLIERHDPDVVFMDIRIPDGTGLEVLEKISTAPFVVFTTAYVDFAVDAFEHGAVDYLVKPFGHRRFRQTLNRIEDRLAAVARRPATPEFLTRVFVRQDRVILPLEMARVAYFETAGDYVLASTTGGSFVLSISLSELQTRLDPESFIKVHRSCIVNLKMIEKMRRHDDRRIAIQFADGKRIVASRSGSASLRTLFV